MEEKTTITFNISGGNNQILPNATEAVQNFYGSEFSKSVSQEENDFQNSLSATEVQKLHVYIKEQAVLTDYVSRLKQCKSAAERVNVDQELAVKGVFIEMLKELVPDLEKGGTVNNIRQRIQDAWMKRPNKKK